MRTSPWFLTAEPQKRIEPKLDFFLSYGYTHAQLINLICRDPKLLSTGLNSRIRPNMLHLEWLLGSKSLVLKACQRGPWLLRNDIQKTVLPVVSELKAFGVLANRIGQMFVTNPLVLSPPVTVIRETLNKLKGLGMNPDSTIFVSGLVVMVATKKTTWERKLQLYKSFGLSEDDVLSAFSRQPTCMLLSDDKIKKMMGLFKDTFNWDSAMVVKRVALLTVSLEKRIIPRCAVMEVLIERGLWNGKPSLYTLLCISEKRFEERFIENYKDKVPGLRVAYQGRMEYSGFASAKFDKLNRYLSNGTVK
ncbi:uncharacterized protein LOC144553283 [Carex rostrata]